MKMLSRKNLPPLIGRVKDPEIPEAERREIARYILAIEDGNKHKAHIHRLALRRLRGRETW